MRVLRPADSPGPRVQDQLQDSPADPLSPASEFEPTPPLVLVRWRDAWFDPEQMGPDDWRLDYPVQTVGFLVRNDGVVVSVAQEILPDGDGYRAVTHIPAPIITSMTVLTEAGPSSSNGHGHKNGSNGNGSHANGSNGNGSNGNGPSGNGHLPRV